MKERRSRAIGFGLAAALFCTATLWFFWPGVAHYDSVAQYAQVVSGSYSDWHPPAMARLWSVFHALGWPGQGPMFLLQSLLYWLGLGLIAAGLARNGSRVAAIAVLAIGLWPPLIGWQAVVIKDAQMASALLAATGLIAWKRLRGEPVGYATIAAVVLLIGYAMLVRSNAVFAVAPLAMGLVAPWRWRDWLPRFGLIAAIVLAVLMASPTINHRLFGASPSGVEATLPIFDMAGIAHRAGPDSVPLIPPDTWQRLEAQRCYSSILWDIFSTDKRCDFVQDNLHGRPSGEIFAGWANAIREHPIAHAAHRIAHWNATMRWFVPWHFPQAIPQAQSQPNVLGLGSPGRQAIAFDRFAGWLADSPLGAPILAFAVALAVLMLARPARSAAHGLAVPLALSAVMMELSFLVVSIADDWRYHLWSMLAAWLSACLLMTEPPPRRDARIALAMLLLVALTGSVARVALPQVGDSYEDLIR